VGAGVPEGLAVFGVFESVQIFFGHDFFLLFVWGENKNISPLKKSGVRYIKYVFHGSTLVTAFAVTHDRFNGRTRRSISASRLRSGIIQSRGTAAFHHRGGLSGNLTFDACLRHSLLQYEM
jgi:hypothetical protein